MSQESARTLRAQLETSQVRQEADRRVKEKEDEAESFRRHQQRVLDSMQATVEAETKAKVELMRNKKKLENDIHQMELTVDHISRVNTESQTNLKKANCQVYRRCLTASSEKQIDRLMVNYRCVSCNNWLTKTMQKRRRSETSCLLPTGEPTLSQKSAKRSGVCWSKQKGSGGRLWQTRLTWRTG